MKRGRIKVLFCSGGRRELLPHPAPAPPDHTTTTPPGAAAAVVLLLFVFQTNYTHNDYVVQYKHMVIIKLYDCIIEIQYYSQPEEGASGRALFRLYYYKVAFVFRYSDNNIKTV